MKEKDALITDGPYAGLRNHGFVARALKELHQQEANAARPCVSSMPKKRKSK